MGYDRGMLVYVHKSIELKLLAKTLVEHAGGNEATQSAPGDSLSDGITQPGRLCDQCFPNRFRHHSRIVSAFDSLQSRGDHALSFLRVNLESDFRELRLFPDFRIRIKRFDQHRAHAKPPDLMVERLRISFHGMFARGIDSPIRRGKKTQHRTDVDDSPIARLPHSRQD